MPQRSAKNPRKRAAPSTAPDAPPPFVSGTADLAAWLGLSQWSVSRAINGQPGVGEETRQRVLKAMRDTGFAPNPLARGLRGRRTGTVGVCFGRLKVPILDEKIFGLQEFLRKREFHCLLETTRNDPATEARVLEHFRRSKVDGVVLVQPRLPETAIRAALGPTPAVCIDPLQARHIPSVVMDRAAVMRRLIEHLLDLGHRRFALLGITPGDTWRWPALADSLKRRGLDPESAFWHHPPPGPDQSPLETGVEAASLALRRTPRPTALICLNDFIALGAVHSARNLGLDVPADVSITGFDNQDIARILRPMLTTVEQRSERMVAVVGDMLLKQISQAPSARALPPIVTLEPIVIFGESTGPAHTGDQNRNGFSQIP